jgi:hypothetical protein
MCYGSGEPMAHSHSLDVRGTSAAGMRLKNKRISHRKERDARTTSSLKPKISRTLRTLRMLIVRPCVRLMSRAGIESRCIRIKDQIGMAPHSRLWGFPEHGMAPHSRLWGWGKYTNHVAAGGLRRTRRQVGICSRRRSCPARLPPSSCASPSPPACRCLYDQRPRR